MMDLGSANTVGQPVETAWIDQIWNKYLCLLYREKTYQNKLDSSGCSCFVGQQTHLWSHFLWSQCVQLLAAFRVRTNGMLDAAQRWKCFSDLYTTSTMLSIQPQYPQQSLWYLHFWTEIPKHDHTNPLLWLLSATENNTVNRPLWSDKQSTIE